MKNNFDEIMKALGYERTDCKADMDIDGGFQDVEPMLMVLIAEVLANVISGDLPAQAMNSLGNWLQLIGQVIQMYNAQQQYYESGPGMYFNRANKNIYNPFCNWTGNGECRDKKHEKKKKRNKKGNNEN